MLCLSGTQQAEEASGSRAKDAAAVERELLLAANSVGSAKSRHGGSVYDLLVAEIKVHTLALLSQSHCSSQSAIIQETKMQGSCCAYVGALACD